MLTTTLKFQLTRIKSNLLTFSLIVVTALLVLYVGLSHGTVIQAVGYLFIMWFCSFLIDFYALKRPVKNDFPVRNSKRETSYFFLCVLGGVLFLFIRFCLDWEHINQFLRLAAIPLILFAFPIALAIIMLVLKYKPKDLGIRFQGLLIALPIIAVSFITNRIVSSVSLTCDAGLHYR